MTQFGVDWDVKQSINLEVVDVLRESAELVVGRMQFVDGVSQRTEAVRQFNELVVRKIQPADVLGEAELLRDDRDVIVRQVEPSHALEIVEVGRQLRQLVVRYVDQMDLRYLHLRRSQLLQLVVRHVQSNWQLVHAFRIFLHRVV